MKSITIFGEQETSKKLIKKEFRLGEEFKNHPIVSVTEKVIDFVMKLIKQKNGNR